MRSRFALWGLLVVFLFAGAAAAAEEAPFHIGIMTGTIRPVMNISMRVRSGMSRE